MMAYVFLALAMENAADGFQQGIYVRGIGYSRIAGVAKRA